MDIFPDKVFGCQILKESDRHGATDQIAEVKANACTSNKAYQFIRKKTNKQGQGKQTNCPSLFNWEVPESV